MSELDDRRKTLEVQEIAGNVEMIRVARNMLRAAGRRAAAASNGAQGWCNWHEELHDAALFYTHTETKSGLRSECVAGMSERRETPTAVTKAPQGESVPQGASGAAIRTRKCRRKSCSEEFTPNPGNKSRNCPAHEVKT